VGCGVLSALLLPTSATSVTQTIYGAIGALIGLFLFVLVVYLVQFIIAPYRQRNEAIAGNVRLVQEYNELQQSIKEQKQSGFHLEFNDQSILTTDNKLLLGITFFSAIAVIVDNLQLEYKGEKFQPFEWSPFRLEHIHSKNYIFDGTKMRAVSDIKHQEANFTVLVDHAKHESPAFNIYQGAEIRG